MPTETFAQLSTDYARIEQAIRYLAQNFQQQPTLPEIAGSVGLSEYHFQRLFTRWAGISPKRFLQFLTVEYAKQLLAESTSVLEATYEAGLSSPGRLHDLFVTCEAVTPGQFKQNGQGVTIAYGFHPSPFGECLLAVTERGICGLAFVTGDRQQALADLRQRWQEAILVNDLGRTQPLAERIFEPAGGHSPLPVVLKGTNFQLKVWRALLNIPPGAAVSYQDVAVHIGRPGAARAVGQALARNPVGFLIPCHRVIRRVGLVGEYAWGSTRKQAILGWEAARQQGEAAMATHPGRPDLQSFPGAGPA